jgi:hypothetical protein
VTAVELLRSQGAPATAAALAYCVLRNAKAEVFFAWQPFLVPALKWGVIEVADGCAELASACLGLTVSDEQIGARLEHVANYIDDEHWCVQAVATWGFGSVALRPSGNPNVPLDLIVSEEGHWLVIRASWASRGLRWPTPRTPGYGCASAQTCSFLCPERHSSVRSEG